jgi:hypothetical protein
MSFVFVILLYGAVCGSSVPRVLLMFGNKSKAVQERQQLGLLHRGCFSAVHRCMQWW